MKAIEKLQDYRNEIRHQDYRIRELHRILKRKKKESGEAREKRTLDSIKESIAAIEATIKELERPAIPKRLDAAGERLLASIEHYEASQKEQLKEIKAAIKKRKK